MPDNKGARHQIRIVRVRNTAPCFRPVYLVIAVLYLELIWATLWLLEVIVSLLDGNFYYSIGFLWLITDSVAIYYTDKGVRNKDQCALLVYVVYKPLDILLHMCLVVMHALQVQDMFGLIEHVSKEATAIVVGCAQWFVVIYYRRLLNARTTRTTQRLARTTLPQTTLNPYPTIPFTIPRAKVHPTIRD